jgi:tetratricopeptide (TPR) repeat protein
MNLRRSAVTAATALFIAVASLLAYANVRSAPFQLDDLVNIVDNPAIRARSLSLDALATAAFGGPAWLTKQRPLPYASFAVNYSFGQLDPAGYHAVNLALLVLGGLAVFWFGTLLAARWLPPPEALLVGACGAVLWTLHPLQTNQTTYIVQRITSLAVLFYFLACSFLLLAERRGKLFLVPAAACAALACASKEIACVLPLSVLLYKIASDEAWYRFFVLRRAVLWSCAAAFLIGLAAVGWHFREGYAILGFTLAERLLTEPRVLLWYLGLFFAPLPGLLRIEYDFPLSRGLLSPPATLLAIAVHCGILIVAARNLRRHPLPSLMVLLFYAHHLIESTVMPLDIAFEHRMCLPGVFLALLVAALAWGALRRLRGATAAAVAFGAATLLAGTVLAAATHERNKAWASWETLWQDTVRKSPRSVRAWLNLGTQQFQAKSYDEARRSFLKVLELQPDSGAALVNLGIIHYEQGSYQQALDYLGAAERAGYQDPDVYYNAGLVLERLRRPEPALASFRRAIELFPGIRDARVRMALIERERGRGDLARQLAEEELRLDPENREARALLAAPR